MKSATPNNAQGRGPAAAMPNAPSRPPDDSPPSTVGLWKALVVPMGQQKATRLCLIMATAWDARPWTDEKMELFSAALADLDYLLASKAVQHLIKTSKWPPTVAEVRDVHDRLLRRRVQAATHQADRTAARLLTGPEARDRDGKLRALAPIRDVIARLQDKARANPPTGIFSSPIPAPAPRPAPTPADLEARKALLREQAGKLRQD